jgi:uncharacterized protein (TIGR03000 family)
MNWRVFPWVGGLALAGAAFFSEPGRAAPPSGHFNRNTYPPPSPSLIYPFTGRYPWQVFRTPYYGPYTYRTPSLYRYTHYDWYYASSPTIPPKVERPQPEPTAHITIKTLADAEIWFDGTKMTETGPVRQFYSPPLKRGLDYSYEIRSRWRQDGRTITQTREVFVSAGSHITVDFTNPERPEK